MLHWSHTAARVSTMPPAIQPHILIVDDDSSICALLTEYFTENGLRVSSAQASAEMSAILADTAIDLVVLDLRLAGEDGMAIARTLREQSAIPIIMLTGVRDEADRVMGLELGADDYLTKPFSPRELLARVRTVLRRAAAAAPVQARESELRAFRFAEFELNLRTRRLTRQDGSQIDLTNSEFNLMAALLASPQRVMSRDQLIEASRVYDNEVYDRAIDVQVMRLRRKIEPDPAHPTYIITERGAGYSFTPRVEKVY
jgi:two-component system OmpR family response regulator